MISLLLCGVHLINQQKADEDVARLWTSFENRVYDLVDSPLGFPCITLTTDKGPVTATVRFGSRGFKVCNPKLSEREVKLGQYIFSTASLEKGSRQVADLELGVGASFRDAVLYDARNKTVEFVGDNYVIGQPVQYLANVNGKILDLPIGLDGTIWLSQTVKIEWNDPNRIVSRKTHKFPVRLADSFADGIGMNIYVFPVEIQGRTVVATIDNGLERSWFNKGSIVEGLIKDVIDPKASQVVAYGKQAIKVAGKEIDLTWQRVDQRFSNVPKDMVVLGRDFLKNFRFIHYGAASGVFELQEYCDESVLTEDRDYTVVRWAYYGSGKVGERLVLDKENPNIKEIEFPCFVSSTKRPYKFVTSKRYKQFSDLVFTDEQ